MRLQQQHYLHRLSSPLVLVRQSGLLVWEPLEQRQQLSLPERGKSLCTEVDGRQFVGQQRLCIPKAMEQQNVIRIVLRP